MLVPSGSGERAADILCADTIPVRLLLILAETGPIQAFFLPNVRLMKPTVPIGAVTSTN